jgi:hypothetical protein
VTRAQSGRSDAGVRARSTSGVRQPASPGNRPSGGRGSSGRPR